MSVAGSVLIACHYSSPSTLNPIFAVEFRQQSEGTEMIWMSEHCLLTGCGATSFEALGKVLQFVRSQVVLIQILLISQ